MISPDVVYNRVYNWLSVPDSTSYLETEVELRESGMDCGPSLSTGLEELRRIYDKEEARRQSVSSKSTGILAINGIILSLSGTSVVNMGILSTFTTTSLLIISILLCLWILKSQPYLRPIPTKNHHYKIQQEKEQLKSELFRKYFASVNYNNAVNNTRYEWFKSAFYSTGSAFLVLTASISFPHIVDGIRYISNAMNKVL